MERLQETETTGEVITRLSEIPDVVAANSRNEITSKRKAQCLEIHRMRVQILRSSDSQRPNLELSGSSR